MFGRATIRLGIGPHSSCVCLVFVHGLLIRASALIKRISFDRGPWSRCMLACGNYAVLIEHRFWVPPDGRADNY